MNTHALSPDCQQSFFTPRVFPFVEIRLTRHSSLPYAEHFHEAFSLGLVLEGSTRFILQGTAYLAQAGDVVLIPAKAAHSCNPVDGGMRGYCMAYIAVDWLHAHVGGPLWASRRGWT